MIRIDKISKCFGETTVLHDVSATFSSHQIHGLIGRNGSGKTVLLKCICGLISPTSGQIYVRDKLIGKDVEMPDSMGALIEYPGFLPNYSGERNLGFLNDINQYVSKERIKALMQLVGLDSVGRKHVGKYSRGMKQRLGIAQAIMENPDLIILDEPMNGLDKNGVADMRRLFLHLREEGKTIILASHDTQDINELCDHVYEMDAGVLTQVR